MQFKFPNPSSPRSAAPLSNASSQTTKCAPSKQELKTLICEQMSGCDDALGITHALLSLLDSGGFPCLDISGCSEQSVHAVPEFLMREIMGHLSNRQSGQSDEMTIQWPTSGLKIYPEWLPAVRNWVSSLELKNKIVAYGESRSLKNGGILFVQEGTNVGEAVYNIKFDEESRAEIMNYYSLKKNANVIKINKIRSKEKLDIDDLRDDISSVAKLDDRNELECRIALLRGEETFHTEALIYMRHENQEGIILFNSLGNEYKHAELHSLTAPNRSIYYVADDSQASPSGCRFYSLDLGCAMTERDGDGNFRLSNEYILSRAKKKLFNNSDGNAIDSKIYEIKLPDELLRHAQISRFVRKHQKGNPNRPVVHRYKTRNGMLDEDLQTFRKRQSVCEPRSGKSINNHLRSRGFRNASSLRIQYYLSELTKNSCSEWPLSLKKAFIGHAKKQIRRMADIHPTPSLNFIPSRVWRDAISLDQWLEGLGVLSSSSVNNINTRKVVGVSSADDALTLTGKFCLELLSSTLGVLHLLHPLEVRDIFRIACANCVQESLESFFERFDSMTPEERIACFCPIGENEISSLSLALATQSEEFCRTFFGYLLGGEIPMRTAATLVCNSICDQKFSEEFLSYIINIIDAIIGELKYSDDEDDQEQLESIVKRLDETAATLEQQANRNDADTQ